MRDGWGFGVSSLAISAAQAGKSFALNRFAPPGL
jgi:hypothetical protein